MRTKHKNVSQKIISLQTASYIDLKSYIQYFNTKDMFTYFGAIGGLFSRKGNCFAKYTTFRFLQNSRERYIKG